VALHHLPILFLRRLGAAWQHIALWSLPFWLAFFFVARALKNEENFGTYSNCVGCFWLPTVAHDLWLAALALVLLALGYAFSDKFPLRFLKFLFRLSAIFIIVVIAVAFVVDDIFHQRFIFADFFRFSGDTKASLSVILAWFAPPYGKLKAVAVVLFVASVLTVCCVGRQRKKEAMALGSLALACLLSAAIMSQFPVRYIHGNAVWNIFEVNRPSSRTERVTEPLRSNLIEQAGEIAQTCHQEENVQRTNVIVLLLESWSSWQSSLFGGSENWTPHLDEIAQTNHYFPRFYANSYMTAGGEIAVIAGEVPLPIEEELYAGFSHFENDPFSIPNVARKAGYESAFITTSDLSFLALGDWLSNLQFDTIEGSRHPFYEGMKRWQFDAPEDSALYARFLQWLETQEDERPFVAVMLTVSTHPPFINPETGANDFEGSFRYMDRQAAHFYEALEKSGFFEKGVLIITGDHRTMTPLRPGEYEQYGDRAFARVPMVVAGKVDMPKVVDDAFQQSDIAPSIAEFLGLNVCRSPFMGSFLKEKPEPPKYVVHLRGDDRDRVDVYYDENEVAGFRLDGDNSRWMGKPPPDKDMVAAWITEQRVRAKQ